MDALVGITLATVSIVATLLWLIHLWTTDFFKD